jgi:hypothetical protein
MAVRKVVDEQGGRSKSRLSALLEVFGYESLTRERATVMQDALTNAGVHTRPAISELRGRFWKSSVVIVERAVGESSEHDRPDEEVEINRAGAGLALAGAALAVIAVFLPRVESTTFAKVQENSLIQSGDGWLFIIAAVLVTAAIYRAYQQRRKTMAPIIIGVFVIGLAIYNGTGDRMELAGSSLLGETISETATPGVGIYAAGAGGLLMTLGGAWLGGFSVGAGGKMPPARRTMTCPDCAETILFDANVCKHCGYRFGASRQQGVAPHA